MNKSLHVMLVKEIHIQARRPIMHSHQKYKTATIIRLPGKSKIELLCCTNKAISTHIHTKTMILLVPTTIPAVRFPRRPAMIGILLRSTPDKYSTPIFLCTIYKNESLVMYNLYSELQYAMHLLVGKLPM